MPRIPPGTPLLDIEIRESITPDGQAVKALTIEFGALQLLCRLDEAQVNQLLRALVSDRPLVSISLPIHDMRPLTLPPKLRGQPLTPELLKARKMPE